MAGAFALFEKKLSPNILMGDSYLNNPTGKANAGAEDFALGQTGRAVQVKSRLHGAHLPIRQLRPASF